MDKIPSDLERRIENIRVPESLMQQLHDARLRFHDVCFDLEQVMADSEDRHEQRVAEKKNEVRQAEELLEAASAQIQLILDRPF
jgi:hypothetical protein